MCRLACSFLHPYVQSPSCVKTRYLTVTDGGWLQFGSPNGFSGVGLLGDSPVSAIIVMPAYRLNVFGFLYSSELEHDAATAGETTGNHGFWDQRLALEWTRDNIRLFGGNAENITVGGYSAGMLVFAPTSLHSYLNGEG